jgi:hypothetical protein
LENQHVVINVGYDPQVIQFSGTVEPANSNTTTTWTATDRFGIVSPLGAGLNVNWTVNVNQAGMNQITMTTKDNRGNVVGTASMWLFLNPPPK